MLLRAPAFLSPQAEARAPFQDCNAGGVGGAVHSALGARCDADPDGMTDESPSAAA